MAVCLLGIFIAALAGATKEKEMPAEEKQKAIAEFDFKKGILVATFSGVMSACFSFGLTAGNPIGEASVAAGTRSSGPVCRSSSSSCSADSPPTSSGASA